MASHPVRPTHQELSRALKPLDLAGRLARCGLRTVFVAAPELHDLIPADALAATISPSDVAGDVGKRKLQSGNAVVVTALDDETALKAEIAAFAGDRPVFGLVGDLALAAMAGLDDPRDSDTVRARPWPDRLYAVLCTARSGSTYFCHLLQNTGLVGHPKEHLRPPVIFAQRYRRTFGFSLADWIALTAKANAHDGVFGTKIIDNFVDDLLPLLGEDDRVAVADILARCRFIHFERLDKAAQTVSKFMAESTRVWHLRNADKADAYAAAKAAVPYDGRALRALHDGLVDNEERIRRFLAASAPDRLHVTYEHLQDDPETVIRSVVEHIRDVVAPELTIVHTRYQKMRDETSAAFADRFRAEQAT